MKRKRHTLEDKLRILQVANRSGKKIADICRDANISVQSLYLWRQKFGHLASDEARGIQELQRQNDELRKMLMESQMNTLVLEAICEKKFELTLRRA